MLTAAIDFPFNHFWTARLKSQHAISSRADSGSNGLVKVLSNTIQNQLNCVYNKASIQKTLDARSQELL